RRSCLVQRAFDDSADIAEMLSRRQLRHHTAPVTMNRHLRSDDARSDSPWPSKIPGLFDDRRGRLVARGFDAEDPHLRRAAAPARMLPPATRCTADGRFRVR